jgi:hypothetical protein
VCSVHLKDAIEELGVSGESEEHQLIRRSWGFPVPLEEFPFYVCTTAGVFYSTDGELLLRFDGLLLFS